MKCMFLNLMLCMVSLHLNKCKTVLIHFCLQLELELFPFDSISNVVGCVAGQTLGIELLDFFGHQYQMLPITYHNSDIAFL